MPFVLQCTKYPHRHITFPQGSIYKGEWYLSRYDSKTNNILIAGSFSHIGLHQLRYKTVMCTADTDLYEAKCVLQSDYYRFRYACTYLLKISSFLSNYKAMGIYDTQLFTYSRLANEAKSDWQIVVQERRLLQLWSTNEAISDWLIATHTNTADTSSNHTTCLEGSLSLVNVNGFSALLLMRSTIWHLLGYVGTMPSRFHPVQVLLARTQYGP